MSIGIEFVFGKGRLAAWTHFTAVRTDGSPPCGRGERPTAMSLPADVAGFQTVAAAEFVASFAAFAAFVAQFAAAPFARRGLFAASPPAALRAV